MPLGVSISRKPPGDAKKFIPLAKKVMKLGKSVKIVCLDKGYDDEKIHEYIRELMEALLIIPARNENVPIHTRKIIPPLKEEENRTIIEEGFLESRCLEMFKY